VGSGGGRPAVRYHRHNKQSDDIFRQPSLTHSCVTVIRNFVLMALDLLGVTIEMHPFLFTPNSAKMQKILIRRRVMHLAVEYTYKSQIAQLLLTLIC